MICEENEHCNIASIFILGLQIGWAHSCQRWKYHKGGWSSSGWDNCYCLCEGSWWLHFCTCPKIYSSRPILSNKSSRWWFRTRHKVLWKGNNRRYSRKNKHDMIWSQLFNAVLCAFDVCEESRLVLVLFDSFCLYIQNRIRELHLMSYDLIMHYLNQMWFINRGYVLMDHIYTGFGLEGGEEGW